MMMLITMMMMPGSVEGCWAKDAGGWSTGSDNWDCQSPAAAAEDEKEKSRWR